jgi:hypothetical protein
MSAYLLLILCTCLLALIQVIVIHGYYQFDALNALKKHQNIKWVCNKMEGNYLIEEVIYLVPALIFFIVLWAFHRMRRFNKYIMIKFKAYFDSTVYKQQREIEQKKVNDEKEKKRLEMRKETCGTAKVCCNNCLKNNVSRIFCCLFCCSCCIPPSSNYKCFPLYCCAMGWRTTDFYKVFKAISNMFYYLFCCCIWTRLWERYSEKRKEKKKNELKEKEANKRDIRNSSNPDELDDDGQTDESEFDENQEFKRTTFPFPSMPFSTSNRMQSAAVYVIYTYDVLNIFVYIYTASISTIELYVIFLMKKLSVP